MNNTKKIINSKLKNKISDFCVKISENIGKVEAKFTLDIIFGLISGGSVLLSEIGRNLKEEIGIFQTVKRLSSNLSKFNSEYLCEIKDNLLIQNKNIITKETVISLDGGDINKFGAKKMENLEKIHDGSTGKIELGYNLNSIVATNIDKDGKVKNTVLNLNLYSMSGEEVESENRESIRCIDEVIKIIGIIGIWVLDRGYDRKRGIIKELLERQLTFIIRGIGTRDVYRVKNDKKVRMKVLADMIKTRKRITFFEYKTAKNGEKRKTKISARVGFEKIKIPGIEEKLTLCVLKKLNGELSMMMLTNMEIKDNTDVVKVFSKYSCRWGVEDTYKYMKQEFQLEKIMLKNYKSLQNMMIFVLGAMNFVTKMRKTENKYFTDYLIKQAKALNSKFLKYTEHSIIAGIREILQLNSIGIRDFLRRKINKITGGPNLCLFDSLANPYKILGKL